MNFGSVWTCDCSVTVHTVGRDRGQHAGKFQVHLILCVGF